MKDKKKKGIKEQVEPKISVVYNENGKELTELVQEWIYENYEKVIGFLKERC